MPEIRVHIRFPTLILVHVSFLAFLPRRSVKGLFVLDVTFSIRSPKSPRFVLFCFVSWRWQLCPFLSFPFLAWSWRHFIYFYFFYFLWCPFLSFPCMILKAFLFLLFFYFLLCPFLSFPCMILKAFYFFLFLLFFIMSFPFLSLHDLEGIFIFIIFLFFIMSFPFLSLHDLEKASARPMHFQCPNVFHICDSVCPVWLYIICPLHSLLFNASIPYTSTHGAREDWAMVQYALPTFLLSRAFLPSPPILTYTEYPTNTTKLFVFQGTTVVNVGGEFKSTYPCHYASALFVLDMMHLFFTFIRCRDHRNVHCNKCGRCYFAG